MVHGSIYRLTGKNVTNTTFYVCFALLTYLIWCDISFFGQLAAERTELLMSNKTVFFTKYSVKQRMFTYTDGYLYLPFCRWLNKEFGLADLPWMSPNLVTFVHFSIAVLSWRFFASKYLLYRRIACVMFEIRSCLDLLDGIIYRAQTKTTTLVSGWGSLGYWIDGLADIVGSLFIILGTIYRYNKCPPLKNRSKKDKYNREEKKDIESASKLLSSDSEESSGESLPGVERYTRKYAISVCLLITLSVVVRSKMWDHFQQTYHGMLSVPSPNYTSRQQIQLLNYPSTWLCMWLWKFHSADAFLAFSIIAIFFGKMWQWMRFSLYAVVPNLLIFGGLCQLQVMYLRNTLASGSV